MKRQTNRGPPDGTRQGKNACPGGQVKIFRVRHWIDYNSADCAVAIGRSFFTGGTGRAFLLRMRLHAAPCRNWVRGPFLWATRGFCGERYSCKQNLSWSGRRIACLFCRVCLLLAAPPVKSKTDAPRLIRSRILKRCGPWGGGVGENHRRLPERAAGTTRREQKFFGPCFLQGVKKRLSAQNGCRGELLRHTRCSGKSASGFSAVYRSRFSPPGSSPKRAPLKRCSFGREAISKKPSGCIQCQKRMLFLLKLFHRPIPQNC